MAWNLSIKGKYFYAIDTETPFTVNEFHKTDVRIAKSNTSSTHFRFEVNRIPVFTMEKVSITDLIAENGTDFTDLATFETWKNENTGKSNASANGANLAWSATGTHEQNKAIVQDTETLIEIISLPFASYNADDIIFDPAKNWIDISGIDNNAWITIVVSYLGVIGDADVTPSFRIFPDRNDLLTYFTLHGQSSKQKNGKASSYSSEGFNGGGDVMQVYVETDKNETLSVEGIRVKIALP